MFVPSRYLKASATLNISLNHEVCIYNTLQLILFMIFMTNKRQIQLNFDAVSTPGRAV